MLSALWQLVLEAQVYFGTETEIRLRMSSDNQLSLSVLTECPSQKSGKGLTNAPPCGKQGENVLLVRRQVLQENGGIQDKITACSKGQKSDE